MSHAQFRSVCFGWESIKAEIFFCRCECVHMCLCVCVWLVCIPYEIVVYLLRIDLNPAESELYPFQPLRLHFYWDIFIHLLLWLSIYLCSGVTITTAHDNRSNIFPSSSDHHHRQTECRSQDKRTHTHTHRWNWKKMDLWEGRGILFNYFAEKQIINIYCWKCLRNHVEFHMPLWYNTNSHAQTLHNPLGSVSPFFSFRFGQWLIEITLFHRKSNEVPVLSATPSVLAHVSNESHVIGSHVWRGSACTLYDIAARYISILRFSGIV